MELIRWNPWSLSSILDEDWDFPTIPGFSRMIGQGLNIYETDENLVAQVSLPGIEEKQIDISVDNGVVRISGSMEEKKEEKGKRRYFMSSMTKSFNYSFKLPTGIVEDREPKAELENGILTLTFKKMEKIPPKKIQVISKEKAKEIRA